MATHNILGGVVFQTGILVLADALFRKGALTAFVANYLLLLQAVALIGVLALILIAITLEPSTTVSLELFGVSIWLWLLLPIVFGAIRSVTIQRTHPGWMPANLETDMPEPEPAQEPKLKASDTKSKLWLKFIGYSSIILVSGWACATSAESISEQTQLSSSFMGFAFVAIATSLPEVSTVVASVKRGNISTAISNVLGSNIFDCSLIIVIALIGAGQPLFSDHAVSNSLAAAAGIILTCVYLWGLLERQDKTVWRIGVDSLVVVIVMTLTNWLIFRLG